MGDNKMKKTSLLNTIWICIEALLLATLGVLTIVYAKNTEAWNVIGYITGVLILIDGLLRLSLFVLTRSLNVSKLDLYRGISEVTFGVFVLIRPEIVVSYFTLLIAIGLVVIGVVFFIEAIVANVRTSENKWALVASYLLSAIVIGLGIVALIYYPYDLSRADGTNTISILLISIGILFVITAVGIVINVFLRKKKETKESQIIDEKIAEERSKKREAKQKK